MIEIINWKTKLCIEFNMIAKATSTTSTAANIPTATTDNDPFVSGV